MTAGTTTYKDFVGGAEHLPARFDRTLWKANMRAARRALIRARATFEAAPCRARYEQLMLRVDAIDVLRQCAEYLPLYQSHAEPVDHDALLRHASDVFGAELDASAAVVGPWLREAVNDPTDGAWARNELAFWRVNPGRTASNSVMHQVDTDAKDVVIVIDGLTRASHETAVLARARRQALAVGANGYAFRRTDTTLDDLLGYEPDEGVRARLWAALQVGASSMDTINASLRARAEGARAVGFATYAHQAMGHDIGLSPTALVRAMEEALTTVAPWVEQTANDVLRRGRQATRDVVNDRRPSGSAQLYVQGRLEAEARITSQSMTPLARPWNELRLLWHGRGAALPMPPRTFPLERIQNMVIPDLLAVGGWSVRERVTLGRGTRALWRYSIERGGQRAVFLLAPFPPATTRPTDQGYAAYATLLRGRVAFGGVERDPVVLVGMPMALTDDRCVSDLDSLFYLSHELGHALHFLELPGHTFEEVDRQCGSLAEYPAILLEQLAGCPETLRRWSNPRGHRATRRLSYWRRRTAHHHDIEGMAQFAEQGVADLRIHLRGGNPDTIVRSLRRRVGLSALHPQDTRGRSGFDFTANGALFHAYTVGRALAVRRVGMVPQEHAVRSAMVGYLAHVAPVSATRAFRAAWEAHYRVPMARDITEALKGYAGSLARWARLEWNRQNADLMG